MGGVIPFFYYDILARIMPGIMVLAVLRYGGLRMPEAWGNLLTGGWGAVIAPLVVAGAAYVIGVLLEAGWYMPGFSWVAERMSNRAFQSAYNNYTWLNPSSHPDLKGREGLKPFRHAAWDWLILKGAEKPLIFAHAHRFQAEMKLCRHSLLPVVFFLFLVLCNRCGCSTQCTLVRSWYLGLGLATALLFAWGAYAREKRRWLQVLISVDHFQWRWPPPLPPAQSSVSLGDC